MKRFFAVLFVAAAVVGSAAAGRAQTAGDPEEGLALVQQTCAPCHATVPQQRRSPNAGAPRFADLAAAPGMTNAALMVALTTPHAGMPMFTLTAAQRDDIIAYILSLH